MVWTNQSRQVVRNNGRHSYCIWQRKSHGQIPEDPCSHYNEMQCDYHCAVSPRWSSQSHAETSGFIPHTTGSHSLTPIHVHLNIHVPLRMKHHFTLFSDHFGFVPLQFAFQILISSESQSLSCFVDNHSFRIHSCPWKNRRIYTPQQPKLMSSFQYTVGEPYLGNPNSYFSISEAPVQNLDDADCHPLLKNLADLLNFSSPKALSEGMHHK